jgi:hypothetical protein
VPTLCWRMPPTDRTSLPNRMGHGTSRRSTHADADAARSGATVAAGNLWMRVQLCTTATSRNQPLPPASRRKSARHAVGLRIFATARAREVSGWKDAAHEEGPPHMAEALLLVLTSGSR